MAAEFPPASVKLPVKPFELGKFNTPALENEALAVVLNAGTAGKCTGVATGAGVGVVCCRGVGTTFVLEHAARNADATTSPANVKRSLTMPPSRITLKGS
jgi:hypothetical protein